MLKTHTGKLAGVALLATAAIFMAVPAAYAQNATCSRGTCTWKDGVVDTVECVTCSVKDAGTGVVTRSNGGHCRLKNSPTTDRAAVEEAAYQQAAAQGACTLVMAGGPSTHTDWPDFPAITVERPVSHTDWPDFPGSVNNR